MYGAIKICAQLNRAGIGVARCTVERLMRDLRLQGAVQGKPRRTTVPADDPAVRPAGPCRPAVHSLGSQPAVGHQVETQTIEPA